MAWGLIITAGCGNDGISLEPTTTTSVEVDVVGALLTPSDLTGRWSVTAPPDVDSPVIDGAVTEAQQDELPRPELCEDASDEARTALQRLRWQAFRSMELEVDDSLRPPTDRTGHLVFLQQLFGVGEPEEQRTTFALLRDGFQACLGDIPAGEEGPGRADLLPVPQVGDDRFGVLITFEEAGGWAEWRIHQVLVLDGPVIMSLMLGDIHSVDVEPLFSSDDVADLATTATERLRSRTSP